MSTSKSNLLSRIAVRATHGLRAARKLWIVAVGLLYFAGDLWCVAGRESWRSSVTGSFVHTAFVGPMIRSVLVRHDQAFVILPITPDEEPRVLVPSEQSWDELSRLVEQPGTRVASVFAAYASTSDHLHARAISTSDWRVSVRDFGRNAELSPFDTDRALGAVREWNKTCEAKFGLRPIDVDPKRVTTIHPLGILHNTMSLVVLLLLVNALPSVTIGAWRRRRAARRIACGQCPACGYLLGAASIDRCPECGTVVTRSA